jgi:hypothetical protein
MSLQDELKPYIVASLHASRLKEYETIYEERNGRKPNKTEINKFISVLVATGNINKESEDITKEFIKKASKSARKKNIFFNTTFTVSLSTILILFIIILLTGKIPDAFNTGSGLYYTSLVAAVILLLVSIIFTVISFVIDKK